jgi:phosphoribosylanthranilate isomerase
MSVEEARLAISHGADAIGLVSQMPSGPGIIDDAMIRRIALGVPPPVASFLLTAAETADVIADHVVRSGASTVQIVKHIDPAKHAKLAEMLPAIRRVQVIHVEGADALSLIPLYAPHVHAFLLDSGRPNAAAQTLGGTGQTHDWEISARFVAASPIPVFLAGGLKPENIADAIRLVRPYAVDLCSGVRTDGRLDAGKLGRFMDAVARA